MKEVDKKTPSNPTSKRSSNATGTSPSAPASDSPAARPADEQIRMRAYEIYRERGGRVGDDMSDWLRAEREYLEGLGVIRSTSGTEARTADAVVESDRR